MKLGAQFFTLRERNKTPEGLYDSFKKVKEIGYQVVQMSAICQIEAERLKSFSDEFDLPITCTHSPLDRILNDTDALIKEHITYGCPVIGLGMMPKEYHGSIEGARTFIDLIRDPIKRIEDAGLRFAYHNHDFDLKLYGGKSILDRMLELDEDLLWFVPDVAWIQIAGENPAEYPCKACENRLSVQSCRCLRIEKRGLDCGILPLANRSFYRGCTHINSHNIFCHIYHFPLLQILNGQRIKYTTVPGLCQYNPIKI